MRTSPREYRESRCRYAWGPFSCSIMMVLMLMTGDPSNETPPGTVELSTSHQCAIGGKQNGCLEP